MAEAKAAATGSRSNGPQAARPLSPHLFIFRPYINMMVSIIHRITGAANYFGSLLLVIWLISAAAGDAQFNAVSSLLGSIPGLVILFGFTWSVMQHMLGGIRHMIWDTGHGFEISTVRALSWGSLIGSVALTGLIWVIAMSQWSVR